MIRNPLNMYVKDQCHLVHSQIFQHQRLWQVSTLFTTDSRKIPCNTAVFTNSVPLGRKVGLSETDPLPRAAEVQRMTAIL